MTELIAPDMPNELYQVIKDANKEIEFFNWLVDFTQRVRENENKK